jgi:hypothetical protein
MVDLIHLVLWKERMRRMGWSLVDCLHLEREMVRWRYWVQWKERMKRRARMKAR